MLPKEVGEEKAKSFHPERALYFQTNVADLESVVASCNATLQAVPKGSLFGCVHMAAVAPGRKWNHKLVDAAAAFKRNMEVNYWGTYTVNAAVADAINSQYPDNGPFAPRVLEERGVIVNTSSVVAWPVPARCLSYGASKSKW